MNIEKNVVVIGYTGIDDHSYSCAVAFIREAGWPALADALDTREDFVKFYNVELDPSCGDGVDAIVSGTLMVVALHLAGISCFESTYPVSEIPDEYYNKYNSRILPLCISMEIPLIVVGDQPNPSVKNLVAMYVGEDILTLPEAEKRGG